MLLHDVGKLHKASTEITCPCFMQVLLHDIRKLGKPLHRFANHSDEVLQVRSAMYICQAFFATQAITLMYADSANF